MELPNYVYKMARRCVAHVASFISLFLPIITVANEPAEPAPPQEENFILHHIADDHEWHFATIGEKHITIPLPVIVFSKDRGLELFSSSFLKDAHHHPSSYRGYFLDGHGKLASIDPHHQFYDLSITKNVASMLISVVILLAISLLAARRYKTGNGSRVVPAGFWGFFEMIVCFIKDDIAIPNIGANRYMSFMPYLLSVFFFIWLNNLMGLLPGAANVTGNIAVTLVLACFTFIITMIHANKFYWGHIFSPPGMPKWLYPIMVPVEMLGVIIKPLSLVVRLFANITAGHIILLSIVNLVFIFKTPVVGLISVPFGAFMFLLKLLVSFLQAYIFTLLSAIYFGMAVEEHE